jgi:hypothetical protein
MKGSHLFRLFFFVLHFFIWTSSSVWAVPLSLDQNIKAILANQERSVSGFDFIVIGDTRDGTEIFNRLLNRAKTLNPLFILHTGDMVREGQFFEYDTYQKQIDSCEIPILHLPGNHDLRYGLETFRKYVGESNYFFDLGGFRIIGLDKAAGKFNAETVVFARKILTSPKICLVAFRMPPAIGWGGPLMPCSTTNNEEVGAR